MASILDEIVERKREEIAAARLATPLASLQQQLSEAPPVRDFLAALRDPPGVQIIAEFKKASPSAGAINATADVVEVAHTYERHGAACISVLTDGPFFRGSLNDLRRVRAVAKIPVLRKDFILDSQQIVEARLAGADAVLLIAEILADNELLLLRREIEALGMTALVECHDPENLRRIVASGARLIGINNRDLRTFETTLERTLQLASQVGRDRCLVSESGIRTRADVEQLATSGVKAVLVGETLMRAGDPGAVLATLLGK